MGYKNLILLPIKIALFLLKWISENPAWRKLRQAILVCYTRVVFLLKIWQQTVIVSIVQGKKKIDACSVDLFFTELPSDWEICLVTVVFGGYWFEGDLDNMWFSHAIG